MKKLYQYSLTPHSYIAEEILLGTILVIPRIFPNIIQLIQTDFFFLESHQILYINLKSLYQSQKLNPTELVQILLKKNFLNKVGGIKKIIHIITQSHIFIASTYLNIYIIEIIETIKINYIKRLMIQYGYNIIELAYKPNLCGYSLYNKASNYLNITNNKLPVPNLQNFQDLIGQILLNLEKSPSLNSTYNHYSIQSGFISIDQFTQGLPNGDLIIIAGRPSTGKTSFILNIGIYILKTTKIGVYLFSLEMSREQILYRCLSHINQISINNILSHQLSHNEKTNIHATCKYLLASLLYINDTPNTSIDYIEYTTKLLIHNNKNLHILMIDYLQLIQINTVQHNNRVQELSYITRKLKLLAQYLKIPIIVLSQLNRNIETRLQKQPLLSDLRESGCIIYTSTINIKEYYNIVISNYKIKDKICIGNYNIEYIFIIQPYLHNTCHLTHNHKLLLNNIWYKYSYYEEDHTLSIKNNYDIKYQYYIKHILLDKYTKTYDVKNYNYQQLINNNIILHNSIEQDADIVIMLHESQDHKISKSLKILDIIISKNRNGPTGCSNIMFHTNTITFKNLQSNNN